MERGQGVLSFAQFYNMNFDRGFVYVGYDNIIRVVTMPVEGHINCDVPEPFSKVAFCCTPHKVSYHVVSVTYGVL